MRRVIRRRRTLWALVGVLALVGATALGIGSAAGDPPPTTGGVILTGVCSTVNPDGKYINVTVNASFSGIPAQYAGDKMRLHVDSTTGDPAGGSVDGTASGTSLTITNANMHFVSADGGPFDDSVSYAITLVDVQTDNPTNNGDIIPTTVTTVPLPHNPKCTDIGGYAPVQPTRLLDTRHGVGAPAEPVPSGGTIDLHVLGAGPVPAGGVSAVALNITATQGTGAGFVTVYPAGVNRPNASNLNFGRGQTVPNMVVVKVGAGGDVLLYHSGSGTVQLIADVMGYIVAGGDNPPVTPTILNGFIPTTPTRLLDTRANHLTGVSTPGPEAPGTSVLLHLNNGGSPVPGSAGAVVLNVTITGATGSGFLTVWSGLGTPNVSNINFGRGSTIANLVVTPTQRSNNSTDAFVALKVSGSGSAQIIADALGYYIGTGNSNNPNGTYKTISPTRLMDTRHGVGAQGPLAAGTTVSLPVANLQNGTPPASTVLGVILNVTVTQPTSSGVITVWADGKPVPGTSNLNYTRGQTVANLVIAPVAANGKVDIRVSGSGTTHVIADVFGYYAGPPPS